ncbi:MAG: ATP phosphoribosyltransferase [Myxococcota bacterium]
MIRVALPNKGRLSEDLKALFDDAGLPIRGRSERSLTAPFGDGAYEALFVRAADIPEFVADGAADVGITGEDLVQESSRTLATLLDLGIGRCRLALAASVDSGWQSAADVPNGSRIATCFPRLTRRFFEQVGRQVTLVPMSGAAEIAPRLGIADLICDLVSTGSTLRVNGLRELDTVLESSARLVARQEAAGLDAVKELALALSSVLRARDQRYLMANVPKARLAEVRERLPGLNGPTLSEVLGGSTFVAMHAVVPAQQVFRTVADLQALGCQGILVTRIERLVP